MSTELVNSDVVYTLYVALWYLECTLCTLFRTFSPWLQYNDTVNVVLTTFHLDQGLCKIVRTTFQWIVVIQSRGEGPKSPSQICPIFSYFLEPSPRDWKTRIHWNVVPTILNNPEICGHYRKLWELHFKVS